MKKSLKTALIIFSVSLFVFSLNIGRSHLFDWDEVNFAECAREMIETGDYTTVQIDYTPFWEKPPFFFWLQVASMKVFGINEFAARFPNAFAGALVLVVLFYTGRKLIDEKFGLYFATVYGGAFLPFVYFKSGIIDPWFNLFIYLGIYFLMLLYVDENRHRLRNLILSALFVSLSVLTKGPVGALILGLTYLVVLITFHGIKKIIPIKEILVYALLVVLFGGSWFFILILQGKFDIIRDFVVYQIRLFSTHDAGHGGFLLYHFVVLLLGFFPFSVFSILGMTRKVKSKVTDKQIIAYNWMTALFWVVIILFTIVKTKIIHYSSMTYYPLAFFAALVFYKLSEEEYRKAKWYRGFTIVIGLLWMLAIIAIPYIEDYKTHLLPYIRDEFAKQALMTVSVSWHKVVIIIEAVLLMVFVFVLTRPRAVRNYEFLFFVTFLIAFQFNEIIKEIVPRVEKYSQGSAIEFYEKQAGKDVYVYPLGFKSYAHLFYTKKPPYLKHFTASDLLRCKTDKPSYIVAKIKSADELEKHYKSGLRRLYARGGFVFYEVMCPKTGGK